ncbi:hypothetical protein GCM10010844_12170 [Deinococcus radiotolerans]|uniref:Transposase n=1 Tax=Deinococcus radiotolerans TaxID=1309407 RepID=A0ABQ2FK08_9DEIO|nr:hypothetical protein GCM10010844_12170 [Deinococcus radiotolerans]
MMGKTYMLLFKYNPTAISDKIRNEWRPIRSKDKTGLSVKAVDISCVKRNPPIKYLADCGMLARSLSLEKEAR